MFDVLRSQSNGPKAREPEFWTKYCDGPVVYMLQQLGAKEWVSNQLEGQDSSGFPKWNAASLGSIAYLSIHAPTAEQRKRCKDLFDEYVAHVMKDSDPI